MPTSPMHLYGAALIASTYHITIKVLPPSPSSDRYYTHIHAIHNDTESLPTCVRRSFGTATNDWTHKHLTWNSTNGSGGISLRPNIRSVAEWERDRGYEGAAREIRNLARQKGERLPGRREALGMAWLAKSAKMAVGRVLYDPNFRVMDENEFLVVSKRVGEICEASLYVDGKEEQMFIAKGAGEHHFKAVVVLEDEVMAKYRRRWVEEQCELMSAD